MELIFGFIYDVIYLRLGRLIFGETFDTTAKIPFWKKIVLGLLGFVIAYALVAFVVLGIKYSIKIAS